MKRDGTYIDSPDWITQGKGSNKFRINYDDKSFQYTSTVALDYEEKGKNSQKLWKGKPFINKYNLKERN